VAQGRALARRMSRREDAEAHTRLLPGHRVCRGVRARRPRPSHQPCSGGAPLCEAPSRLPRLSAEPGAGRRLKRPRRVERDRTACNRERSASTGAGQTCGKCWSHSRRTLSPSGPTSTSMASKAAMMITARHNHRGRARFMFPEFAAFGGSPSVSTGSPPIRDGTDGASPHPARESARTVGGGESHSERLVVASSVKRDVASSVKRSEVSVLTPCSRNRRNWMTPDVTPATGRG
jgi:hypothetical protein